MSQRQAQFMQMLKILSDITQGNEDIRLKGEQIGIAKKQIAQQLKESHNKAFADAMTALVDAAPKVRQARNAVYQAGNEFDATEKNALNMILSGAPISQVMLATENANRGQEDLAANNPEELRRIQREAARLASTGQNAGQFATNQSTYAALAGGDTKAMEQLYGKEVAQSMQRANAIRQLTAQTPMGFEVDRSAIQQGFAPRFAAQQYEGVTMGPGTPTPGAIVSPATALNYDIGAGGVRVGEGRNNIDLITAGAQSAAAMAQAMGKQGVSVDDKRMILSDMGNLIGKLENKNASELERQMAINNWNSSARLGGFPELWIPDPKKASEKVGMFKRMLGLSPSGQFLAGPPQPQQQPPVNPMNYFAPPPGAANQIPPQGFNPWNRPPQQP